jgi:hypothetical protein
MVLFVCTSVAVLTVKRSTMPMTRNALSGGIDLIVNGSPEDM